MADEPTACEIAFQRGLGRIFELCDEEGSGAGMDFAQKMLGVNPEPDRDCEEALQEGLNDETCEDFRGVRQWVLCRVFNEPPDGSDPLLEVNDGDFEAAISQSWDMAKTQCEDEGIEV